MNINKNVDQRAQHTLKRISDQFGLPMTGWDLVYEKNNKWLSRIYKLKLIYSFSIPSGTFAEFAWLPWQKRWQNKGKGTNHDHMLLLLNQDGNHGLSEMDFETVELKLEGETASLSFVPIPGCFVWTLLPPMHYHVKLKPFEMDLMKRFAGDTERLLKKTPALQSMRMSV
jgi:hypothetical protein